MGKKDLYYDYISKFSILTIILPYSIQALCVGNLNTMIKIQVDYFNPLFHLNGVI